MMGNNGSKNKTGSLPIESILQRLSALESENESLRTAYAQLVRRVDQLEQSGTVRPAAESKQAQVPNPVALPTPVSAAPATAAPASSGYYVPAALLNAPERKPSVATPATTTPAAPADAATPLADDQYYVPSHMKVDTPAAKPAVPNVRIVVTDQVDQTAFNGTELRLTTSEWSQLQDMFVETRTRELELKQAQTKKVLPQLIRAEVIKEFKPELVKLRRLGEGNFGVVFAADFAIFKVYKQAKYLQRVHACSNQLGRFGISNAFAISHGYVCENVMFDWGAVSYTHLTLPTNREV